MKYRCSVLTPAQKVIQKYYEAPTLQDVQEQVIADGYELVAYREQSRTQRTRHGLTGKQVIEFTQHLSALLTSGLTVKHACEVLVSSSQQKRIIITSQYLSHELQKGNAFSDVLTRISGFSPYYIRMVEIGEETGSLDEILSSLLGYMESTRKLKDTVITALLYPMFILILTVVGITVISLYILPRMERLFSSVVQSGEAISSIYDTIRLISAISICIIAGIIFIVGLFQINRRIKQPNYGLFRLLYRIPLIGKFLIQQEELHFIFSMKLLLSRGLSAARALQHAIGVTGSRYLQHLYRSALTQVEKGASLSQACAGITIFPESFHSWLAIGEEVGGLQEVFSQLYDTVLYEFQRDSKRFSALIEPVFIALSGLLMAGIIMQVVMPMLQLYGTIL